MMLSVDGCIKSVKIHKFLNIFLHFLYIHLHLTSLIKPLPVLMMVQQNRNAIVSTDFVSL